MDLLESFLARVALASQKNVLSCNFRGVVVFSSKILVELV